MFFAKLIATAAILATAIPSFASSVNVLVCSANVYNKEDGTLKDSSTFVLDSAGSSPTFHFDMGGLNTMVIKSVEVQVAIDGFDEVLTTTLGDQKEKKYFFHPAGQFGAVFGNKKFFGMMNCKSKSSKLVFRNSLNQVTSLDINMGYSLPGLADQVLSKNQSWCIQSNDVAASAKAFQKLFKFSTNPSITESVVTADGSLKVSFENRECAEYKTIDTDTPADRICTKEKILTADSVTFPVCK